MPVLPAHIVNHIGTFRNGHNKLLGIQEGARKEASHTHLFYKMKVSAHFSWLTDLITEVSFYMLSLSQTKKSPQQLGANGQRNSGLRIVTN